jgi:hypothetical protein
MNAFVDVVAAAQVGHPAIHPSSENQFRGCGAEKIGLGEWKITLDEIAGDPDLGDYGVATAAYGGGADHIVSWNGAGSERTFYVFCIDRRSGDLIDNGFSFIVFRLLPVTP